MAPSGLTLTWVGDRRRRARAPPPSDSAGTAVLTDLLQANAALSAPSANSAFCGIFVLICVLLLVSCVCVGVGVGVGVCVGVCIFFSKPLFF